YGFAVHQDGQGNRADPRLPSVRYVVARRACRIATFADLAQQPFELLRMCGQRVRTPPPLNELLADRIEPLGAAPGEHGTAHCRRQNVDIDTVDVAIQQEGRQTARRFLDVDYSVFVDAEIGR